MTIQNEDIRPVTVGMHHFFQQNQNVQLGEAMSYASLVSLPILAVLLAFERAFVRSMAHAGVTG
jgi:multiple sugar transport system permease protein